MRKVIRITSGIVMAVCIVFVMLLLYLLFDQKYNKEDLTSVSDYSHVRSSCFSESMKTIWPLTLSDITVKEYKLISYYTDVDAYTGYLMIGYSDKDYRDEVARLKGIKSDEYKGRYNISEFNDYEVLAIKVSETTDNDKGIYNGLTYALDIAENMIVYVEMEFPHNKPRGDYKKIIPEDYLPKGLSFPEEKKYYEFFGIVTGVVIPFLLGLTFALIGIKNIRRKDMFGYLEITFAAMIAVFGILNILA